MPPLPWRPVVFGLVAGIIAFIVAGAPALAALLLLLLVHGLLMRCWPDLRDRGNHALWIAALGVVLAQAAFSLPLARPAIETHGRYLAALRADPYLVWDPTEYQEGSGAFTRTVGGPRLPLPRAALLYLLAWPLAPAFGNAEAVGMVTAAGFGLTLILTCLLALALGSGLFPACLAQAILLALPVTLTDALLGRAPAFFGQAFDVLVLVHLVRRYPHLDGARDAAAASLFLALAEAANAGSMLSVTALVGAFVLLELWAGDRRRALRLLGAFGVATAAVAAALHGGFLIVLGRDVLPQWTAPPPRAWSAEPGIALLAFVALVGFLTLRAAPRHARGLLAAAVLGGGVLYLVSTAWPALLGAPKGGELMAVPVAIFSAAALSRRRPTRPS